MNLLLNALLSLIGIFVDAFVKIFIAVLHLAARGVGKLFETAFSGKKKWQKPRS